MRKWLNWLIVSLVGFLIAFLAFAFNQWILPIFIHSQVSKTLALNPGTDLWDIFVKTPIPIYMSVYIFNVVNPEGILNGEKPIVKEVGPYVYREYREKKIEDFKDNEETVKFHQYTKYYFDEELSHPLKETDTIRPMNMFLYLVADLMAHMKYLDFSDETLDFAMPHIMGENFRPFIETTPKELLFSGFKLRCGDKNGSLMTKLVCSSVRHFPGLEKTLKNTPDGDLIGSIFGFKNETHNGLFEVDRGMADINRLGRIKTWNKNQTVTSWGTPECNKIEGNEESVLPPFLTSTSKIQLFNTDVCRSMDIVYNGEVEFKGVSGYRFLPEPKFMGDVEEYPENSCYCGQSIENLTVPKKCFHKGILDVSSCQNLPAIMSFPHFYMASDDYQGVIEGLHPEKSRHETFVDIEPTTGIPLRGIKRIQLNIEMRRTSSLRIFKNQINALIPFLWFEEKVELGPAQIAMLRDQLLRVLKIANIIKWVFIAIGILMGLSGLTMSILRAKQEKDDDKDEKDD